MARLQSSIVERIRLSTSWYDVAQDATLNWWIYGKIELVIYMKKDNNRVCLACGENHNGRTCPLILKKLNKYNNSRKKNYLVGNILLKCIEEKTDFLQILLEIAELNEEAYETFCMLDTILPIEQSLEYFAASLSCSSREFFKNPEKTVEMYSKLICVSHYEDAFCGKDDSGKITNIDIPVEISEYTDIETLPDFGDWIANGYSYTLSKIRGDNDYWTYNLYLNLPIIIRQEYSSGYQKEKYPNGRTYFFGGMGETSSNDFLLATDCNGIFEKFFEEELNNCWTDDELITDASLDDSRYEIWINKLNIATKQRLLQWTKFENQQSKRFRTFYGQTEIIIYIYKKIEDSSKSKLELELESAFKHMQCKLGRKEYTSSELYIRNQEGGLGIRFRDTFDDINDIKYDQRIVALSKQIDTFIVDKENGKFLPELKKISIEYTDVIMATYSMICHNHFIKPLRGIVQLLTKENIQIKYEIYVGYCSECDLYYCFKDDYLEMYKHGTPLCVVYNEETNENKNKISTFQYKSQSVLNAMGYSVGMEADLSSVERQDIIATALHNKLFEIHDLISFLNWLIQTRKTQSKYNNAVKRWKEDLEFVKQYEIENREKVNIDGIVVRK